MKESFDFDPSIYGPVFKELLKEEHLNPLGPGSPHDKTLNALNTLTIDRAFTPYEVLNEDMAKACLSAIWLYHNYLQESHKISQTIQARDGSYWHGIMHRRDLDFNNSKYWFRQVGEHPIFEPLRIFAKVITSKSEPDKSTEFFLKQSIWDPIAFINLCEACIKGRSPSEMLCRKIQQKEWQLLFDYCYWYAIKH